ncbi:MAG: hypothetical protein K0S47_1102 [Herbinix sp.]|nr:hypothetical protein [Herbinix sp.]
MNSTWKDEFQNPGSEFRGAPFWALNCKLDKDQLLRQIDYFKEMGMGGFHLHSRIGLNTPYMGEEFLEMIKACVEKAKDIGLLAWLYDEDRWPSGFGGGLVTKEEKYRSRYIVFSPNKKEYDPNSSRQLLATYRITLTDGYLTNYERLEEEEQQGTEGDNLWYAYLEISRPDPWYNNQTYVDTLNPEAIKRFIETTHDKYAEAVGEHFGTTIPAIFTDEPEFIAKSTLGYPEEKRDIILTYTDDFPISYKELYGEEFFDTLPEIIWELPDQKVSVARYRYHDHITDRFVCAFADVLGDWCKEHNIMLTGHMMEEPTLHSQTRIIGEAMRSYRGFGQPGIDILCDSREYSTAKQAQSAAHQYGCKGITSELYGVTNWDFDFRGHKLQGDWQAALGVITRVHHLAWVSMEGEAKRDYPASIFYQSPWYKEYSYVEDHFARVNLAMTQGKPVVKVGVVHPIESYWLAFGPEKQTEDTRRQLEQNFSNVIDWLLFGLIDFDFISEALLPQQNEDIVSDLFKVGQSAYDVVIIPECKTLRSTTLKRLTSFVQGGGRVIFLGDIPSLVDAAPSNEVAVFAKECDCIPYRKSDLINRLDTVRTVDIQFMNGVRADRYLYQMREENNEKWLFVANGRGVHSTDITYPETIRIIIPGTYHVTLCDTINGTTRELPAMRTKNNTTILHELHPHDSLLLHLVPTEEASEEITRNTKHYHEETVVKGMFPITLSEPNVYILDQAEYAIDEEEFLPSEEVLRIDNILRKRFGYPRKQDAYAQPWTHPQMDKEAGNLLRLRYRISSKIAVSQVKLAVERPELLSITLNGVAVSNQPDGWYTDECIRTIPLPEIPVGESILELTQKFNTETNLEWAYLLGDFGVEVHGATAVMIEPVRELSFGSWTDQGLPFYGGNVTYHCEMIVPEKEYVLQISKYRAPLISVAVNGEKKGNIVFAPYCLNLGELSGSTNLDITVYGNRVNTFGAMHNCDDNCRWVGPGAWRTEGMSYSYEYQLKRCGVLASPRLFSVE